MDGAFWASQKRRWEEEFKGWVFWDKSTIIAPDKTEFTKQDSKIYLYLRIVE
jgi:hypothetical protein